MDVIINRPQQTRKLGNLNIGTLFVLGDKLYVKVFSTCLFKHSVEVGTGRLLGSEEGIDTNTQVLVPSRVEVTLP